MTLSLLRFANGDTNYVAKHNSNADALEAEAESVRQSLAAGFGAAVSLGAAFPALFGSSAAVIGANSYKCTGASTILTVQAGYAWLPAAALVVSRAASATIDFNGLAAATYYVSADATGTPVRNTSATDALYSVVWTGSAFGAITRTAKVVWGAADQIAAQDSTAMGATYETLDAILEAIAAAASAGAKPYIPEIASVTYAASMTADFADADVIRITLAGNPTITLAGAADGQKCVLELKQDATGGRAVTWSANVRYGTDLPSITLSTAGGALDRVGLIYNASAAKYDVVALQRGF
ncbi:hypothetical protein U5817_10055 [Aromatoleum evansii]|uniref:Tail fiber protein n=1 Tax=Aromatoleum evansii TaxID=59406 RepID=A0ABZ1AR90_AROEV|nr:hypothetical protein U5817_09705 [Aromatoleum evansii]WRL48370.1 hypothetical protein U5817_10055 [Aromatoleum evansii]